MKARHRTSLRGGKNGAAKNGNGACIRPKASAVAVATTALFPAKPVVDQQAPTQTIEAEQDKTDKIDKDKPDEDLD